MIGSNCPVTKLLTSLQVACMILIWHFPIKLLLEPKSVNGTSEMNIHLCLFAQQGSTRHITLLTCLNTLLLPRVFTSIGIYCSKSWRGYCTPLKGWHLHMRTCCICEICLHIQDGKVFLAKTDSMQESAFITHMDFYGKGQKLDYLNDKNTKWSFCNSGKLF